MLVGIIWLVQLVHYPAFRYVDRSERQGFHKMHTTFITPIVAPLMVSELGLTTYALWIEPSPSACVLFVIVGLIWMSTFLIQVPIHNRLAQEWKKEEVTKLITSNWIRTILWSIKLGSMILWI